MQTLRGLARPHQRLTTVRGRCHCGSEARVDSEQHLFASEEIGKVLQAAKNQIFIGHSLAFRLGLRLCEMRCVV